MIEIELTDSYRTYGHLVLRRCERMLRDAAAAEHATQETFLRPWRYDNALAFADLKIARMQQVEAIEVGGSQQLSRRRLRDTWESQRPGASRVFDVRQIEVTHGSSLDFAAVRDNTPYGTRARDLQWAVNLASGALM